MDEHPEYIPIWQIRRNERFADIAESVINVFRIINSWAATTRYFCHHIEGGRDASSKEK